MTLRSREQPSRKVGRVAMTYQWIEETFQALTLFPCDAKLIGVEHDPVKRIIRFILESNSFLEVVEGAEPPIYNPDNW